MRESTWVCPICGTNNTSESSGFAACFVCGERVDIGTLRTAHARETGIRYTGVHDTGARAARTRETGTDAHRVRSGRTGGLLAYFADLMRSAGLSEREREGTRVGDFRFRPSPRTSRKTFIDAFRVKDESEETSSARSSRRDRAHMPAATETGRTRGTETPAPAASERHESTVEFESWPEHGIVINREKMIASGCRKVEKIEIGGQKCYKLIFNSGSEKVMPLGTLKLTGYVS